VGSSCIAFFQPRSRACGRTAGGVVQREVDVRGTAPACWRHVVDHVVHDVGRVGVRRRLARLEATALVDRDVDEHRAPVSCGDHVLVTSLGGSGSTITPLRSESGRSRVRRCAPGSISVCSDGRDRGELAQALDGPIHHRDGPRAGRPHLGRVRASDAPAEITTFAGATPHAAEQMPRPPFASEGSTRHLYRHAARHFAHRREDGSDPSGAVTVS